MWHENAWEATGCGKRPCEMIEGLIPPSLHCSSAFVWDRDRWDAPVLAPQSCEQPLSSARWLLALEHSCSGTAFCNGQALFVSCSCCFKVVVGVSMVCLCIRNLVGCHQKKIRTIWQPKKEKWPNFDISINWYEALQSILTVGFDLQKKYVWGETPYLLFQASSGCTGGIPSQLKTGW